MAGRAQKGMSGGHCAEEAGRRQGQLQGRKASIHTPETLEESNHVGGRGGPAAALVTVPFARP
jgi:hypothetical protein